jgi:nicotinamide-nucleotide amidase
VTRRPRAVVLVTGSELVRGDRRDENGPYLAGELVRLGLDVGRIVVVGDREAELEAAIREGLEADVCVLSGGLGPTHDDRTVEVLARAASRALCVDDELERQIEAISREYAARLGRPYADFAAGVRKQASLPDGAVSIGLAGTAPGIVLPRGERVAIALPGPPGELRRLWPNALRSSAFAAVLERIRPRRHRVLRFFGPSESAIAKVLDEAGGDGEGLEVTVCARDYEIHVDLYVEDYAGDRGAAVESVLRDRFAEHLFAEDERSVEETVLALARARSLTLATAESCTGGLVGARLTSVAGSSEVFVGGVVAYSNPVKTALLGVPTELLERHGAASAEVAAAMAEGARKALSAEVAASVTGVAGPTGGTPAKPVGLVFLHVEGPDGGAALTIDLPGDRARVRGRATACTLHLLREVLSRSRDTSA